MEICEQVTAKTVGIFHKVVQI